MYERVNTIIDSYTLSLSYICCSLEFQHIGVAQQEYICIPVLQVESQFKCCRERVRTLMHVHAFRAVLSFFQDASNLLSDQNFRILNSKSAGNRSILKQMIWYPNTTNYAIIMKWNIPIIADEYVDYRLMSL